MPLIVDPTVPNPPAIQTASSPDGVVTATSDPTHVGVKLRANFSDLSPTPFQIELWRDDVKVRSGDPAWSPGGIGIAYDHEAPLAAVSSWRAVPLFRDGTSGAPSASVALAIPEMDDDADCWVKPLADPGKSVALQLHNGDITPAWAGRVNVTPIPGRALPSVTWEARSPAPITLTLRTDTHAELQALNDALALGPVLVQTRSIYGLPDFYAVATDSTAPYFVGSWSALRDVAVTFQPCPRPATLDAALFIPGRSFGEHITGTFTTRLATWPTFADAAGI